MDLLDPFAESINSIGVAHFYARDFKCFVANDFRNFNGGGFKNIAAVDVVQIMVGSGS